MWAGRHLCTQPDELSVLACALELLKERTLMCNFHCLFQNKMAEIRARCLSPRLLVGFPGFPEGN